MTELIEMVIQGLGIGTGVALADVIVKVILVPKGEKFGDDLLKYLKKKAAEDVKK